MERVSSPRANLVNLENVSKAYATTTVFDGISLGVGRDERIGVVGRNGDGKSTLLNLILGTETPDGGRVTRTSGITIAHVDQRGHLDAGTVRAAVVGDGAVHEWAGDAAVRGVLNGLGLSAVGLDADVGRLSGGERRRVALSAALVQRTDLLVLDEPTNHLDVEGITWLATHLVTRRGALLAVTHDRWFLDAVCERTWEVEGGRVNAFDGGYAAYVLARAERARQSSASESRRQNLLRKELAWLRRGAPARTSKPKFRIDAAEALIKDEPEIRSSVELKSLAQRRLGKSVYDLVGVTIKAGDRTLLTDVEWHVGPGDRIALIGVNGSGKSHLLRLLAGELKPADGKVSIGQTVHAGYLSQELAELPTHLRVLEAVREVRASAEISGGTPASGGVAGGGGVELSAGQLAERFGFENQKQWTLVGDLSGGERRRLQLLRLLLTQPNVLLLDEPTNDLDTDTLAALEDLLDSWPGTLIVVSHDRYLIERICDTTMAIVPGEDGNGRLLNLAGGIDEYLARRSAGDDRVAKRVEITGGFDTAPSAPTRSPQPSGAELRAAKKELQRLERQIAKLDEREAALHELLAANATDYSTIAELDAELRSVRSERDGAEEQWLELSENV
jgi:ATP-binding cassette subfamily F protein uup